MKINWSEVSAMKCWNWGFFLLGFLGGAPRSLSKLVVIILWVSCGVLLGDFIYKYLGIIGSCIGFLIGIALSFFFTWGILLGLTLIFLPFPNCLRGVCHDINTYKWHPENIFGRVKWGIYRYKCKCGDSYLRKGPRFMEVLTDGTLKPYKRLKGRKWMNEINDI